MRYSYLACPYAHALPEVRLHRYNAVADVLAERLSRGLPTYSPIVHNHFVAARYNLPKTWDFWKLHDLPLLEKADELLVLMLDGWEVSVGVTAEREFAKVNSIPTHYLEP